jgi:hypothetical protein
LHHEGSQGGSRNRSRVNVELKKSGIVAGMGSFFFMSSRYSSQENMILTGSGTKVSRNADLGLQKRTCDAAIDGTRQWRMLSS